ncbi:MAG: hypothetical protein F2630_05065 [Actinobacteria bacterium]|nr:hypothetical protein [Actinomycetota bacterium]
MGLFGGPPKLKYSDFSGSNIPLDKEQLLKEYVMYGLDLATIGSDGHPLSIVHMNQEIKRRGLDPHSVMDLRAFLLHKGLMRRSQ